MDAHQWWANTGIGLVLTVLVAVLIFILQSKTQKTIRDQDQTWQGQLGVQVTKVDDATERLESQSRNLDQTLSRTSIEISLMGEMISEMDERLRQIAEANSEFEQRALEADIEDPEELDADKSPAGSVSSVPPNEKAYLDEVTRKYGPLRPEGLRWDRKTNENERRGNSGWFLTDLTSGKRFWIHHGHGWSVRKAIPNDALEEWKKSSGLSPRAIDLDYQVGEGRGNHAWYIRTYSGETWKITRGGRGNPGWNATKLEQSS